MENVRFVQHDSQKTYILNLIILMEIIQIIILKMGKRYAQIAMMQNLEKKMSNEAWQNKIYFRGLNVIQISFRIERCGTGSGF